MVHDHPTTLAVWLGRRLGISGRVLPLQHPGERDGTNTNCPFNFHEYEAPCVHLKNLTAYRCRSLPPSTWRVPARAACRFVRPARPPATIHDPTIDQVSLWWARKQSPRTA